MTDPLTAEDIPVVWCDGWYRSEGEIGARRLLESEPLGVFCANDRLAEGFLTAYRATGREVPRVIGFDDAPIATALQLTTVAIPWQAIAEGVRQVVTQQLSRAIRPVPACDAMGLSYMPAPIIRFV
ncbi:MAG: substrate-binding domain-containing protein [Verrucomicrobia bacterium]|nr:substrate-binding domain-containing protein [Verrucomicrobiota bacterium]